MIEIKNLTKSYDKKCILKNINLKINDNEQVSIIGKSGCGKSTLLRCIARLEKIDKGQILIDKTKLTPARILVIFVTAGTILGGLGVYKCLVEFAGCGATVPLTGFGNNLAKGTIEAVKENGIIGAFTGGLKASSGGIAAAIFFGYIASLISKPKMKKQ